MFGFDYSIITEQLWALKSSTVGSKFKGCNAVLAAEAVAFSFLLKLVCEVHDTEKKIILYVLVILPLCFVSSIIEGEPISIIWHVLAGFSYIWKHSKPWCCCSFSFWKYPKPQLVLYLSLKWIHIKEPTAGECKSALGQNIVQLTDGLECLKFVSICNWTFSIVITAEQQVCIQGVSQKIKTDDVFSKLGNQTSVYQRSPS